MKLVPQSLAGQRIALLLIALVLSQVATVLILADERRYALRAANREQVLARTAVLVRLVEQTPAGLHEGLLTAARSPRLAFFIAGESGVERPPATALERRMARRLTELIGDGRQARVSLRGREPWSLRNWDQQWRRGERHGDDDDDDDDNDKHWHRHHWQPPAPINLLASVPLADGSWLNAETALPPPPRAWTWFPMLSMGLMALAILLIVILSVRRITRPLRALSTAADRLGRGESLPPLAETGPREVRRTTAAFNAMQQRLTRFVQDRTRMLAAIGHDLRTPITSLRLRAEFVEDPETKQKILDSLDEMTRMTEAAIRFARDDAAAEATRRVDLTALIQSLTDDQADQGRDVAFETVGTGAEKLAYSCRPTSLKRVLHNLIENALRYAGHARVSLVLEPAQILITVEDSGPGIPEDKLEQVFEPFVRLEASRSQETGGVGLGLAIARSIARAHGGELHLENRREGGLRAILTLPATAKAPD